MVVADGEITASAARVGADANGVIVLDFFGHFHDLIRLHAACETLAGVKRKWQMLKCIGERFGAEDGLARIRAEAKIVLSPPVGSEIHIAAAALHIDGS